MGKRRRCENGGAVGTHSLMEDILQLLLPSVFARDCFIHIFLNNSFCQTSYFCTYVFYLCKILHHYVTCIKVILEIYI